jgi:hypothetical protein
MSGGAGRSEGEGLRHFTVPANAKAVRLQLALEETDDQPHAVYEAELQNGDGQLIYPGKRLRALTNRSGGRSVTFDVPANSLPRGDYQVVLREQSGDGSVGLATRYYFRVLDTLLRKKQE